MPIRESSVASAAIAIMLLVPAQPRLSASPNQGLGGINGSPDAMSILNSARRSAGGTRLQSIRSLLIRGARTIGGRRQAFTYRLLLPDRFQEVSTSTFTVLPNGYWQRPDPGERLRANAELRKRDLFAEVALLYLWRAPLQVPLTATRPSAADRTLVFDGPGHFRRTVTFDAAYRPHTLEEVSELSNTGGSAMATRVVDVHAFREVDGLPFPVKMTEQIGNSSGDIEVLDIVLDRDVTPSDFAAR